ncbi:MAG: prolyl oligopeptidase family serine peptidase [Bacteroidales bacterium]|nr:prolyl oligopeptidase family serine peptidase [Bacteroidales bacterium]
MKKLPLFLNCVMALVAQLFIFTSANAQELKPIKLPLSWKNETTVILVQMTKDSRNYFEYDIKNGTMAAVNMPAPPNATPSVAVKNGDIFYYDINKNEKRITETKSEEKNPVLSPDFTRIAFTRDNNLFSIELATGKEFQYTKDGSDLILNGWASWVYYEEIFGRPSRYRAFWWSPDSRKIAFYRFDDSKVPMFPIYSSDGQHGFITETRYPMAGDPNPSVKIGVTGVEGGGITWADFDESDDQYFGPPQWASDSRNLMIQWMNRDQNNLIVYAINSADGTKKEIYKEFQKTWIDWIEDIQFGELGFYFVRDFDLWEQLYYQSYDGKTLVKLTEGKNWGIKVVNFDEINRTVYFTARREISTRNDFYRLSWDKKMDKKQIVRLSSGEYNFVSPVLSPDKKHFVAIASNISTPSKLILASCAKGGVVKPGELKVIEDSKGDKFNPEQLPVAEMIFITTPDGYRLPASIIWPKNMDRSKKYPVLVNMYGGPNSGTVMDTWRSPMGMGDAKLWFEEGIIQINIDNRASGHCGKEGMNYVHRNLGKYEIQDYIEWAKYLISLPFVNAQKIGITGFSYGGTMTVLALTDGAEYYRYGIAGGGVYDWRLYDSHYVERYMDEPKDNPDGYNSTAVLGKVRQYKSEKGSRLYLTHGTSDDNVHMQNTIQLIDALQKAGKQFDLMLYPGGMHGYRGAQALHDREAEISFWRKNLLDK